jgi:hypothetical protein
MEDYKFISLILLSLVTIGLVIGVLFKRDKKVTCPSVINPPSPPSPPSRLGSKNNAPCLQECARENMACNESPWGTPESCQQEYDYCVKQC